MKKQLFSMALVATTFMACGPSAPQLGKASLDDVIAAMTLEEKAHLVVGTGMEGFEMVTAPWWAKHVVWCLVLPGLLTLFPGLAFPPLSWLMVLPGYASTLHVRGIRLLIIVHISL